MASTNVTIRMDKDLKRQADELFTVLGLSFSTAVGVFCRQAVMRGKIPFELSAEKPNAETLAAMQEIEDKISGKIESRRFTSVDELFEDLDA